MSNHASPLLLILGSPLQLLVIALILLLLFGAGRLGDIGKGLGEGIKNFKKGFTGGDDAKPRAPAPAAPISGSEAKPSAAEPTPSEPSTRKSS